ncbi:MAG TPA: NADH-quinone oxidoreductase subunit M, partial [Gammaproteobacteria bacterium]|nr:NADH-quinone oxidoreductase subunit M [Gammaproteobacteria bacterium]
MLSFQIWLPIIGALFVLGWGTDQEADRTRKLALLVNLFTLVLCIPLWMGFELSSADMQFTEQLSWVPLLQINYHLGVDGISMPLIILNVFTTTVVLFSTWHSIQQRVPLYCAAFLVMQGLVSGVFCALDSILFYVFWEGCLVPMYLIIGMWGSADRNYASIKFFLFTFVGSVFMLIGLLYLAFKANSFAILDFYPLKLSLTSQLWLFTAFFLGFAVKVPMWPVHTWLPDAHTEAPAGGSIMLAAILLKLGAYGFLRFALPIVPDASQALAGLMMALSLIAIIYIAWVAIAQSDMKKLIAYSSISHMGFVTLGFFMIYAIVQRTGNSADASLGMEGGLVVMISHAFVSGALFAGVGYLYDRLHTREIKDFGGIVNTMPIFGSFFMLFAMANAGLPGTSGFVGEFMVIVSSMQAGFWIAVLASSTLIL